VGHGRLGLLVGVAGGIAAGFGIAGLTDYALEEGGGFGVMVLGGGIGAIIGQKIGSSAGRPWEDPGRLQVSLAYAWTFSASRDVVAAFEASRFLATNDSHSIAPSVSVSYRVGRHLHTGLELSGVSAPSFRAGDSETFLTETVGGQSYGVVVSYAPMPAERRRLTYALGAGLDYYDVAVEGYFDPMLHAGYPEDQPHRASRKTDHTFGLQLRGSLEYWLVHDVSLQASLVGRWAGPIEVPGIELTHPLPDRARSLLGHSVDLSSIHFQVGFGMRF
jgi:hypothetical protein